mgnify:FL=1
MAEDLANFYKVDVEKAKIAALLHDCAKNNEEEYFNKFKDKYNLDIEVLSDKIKSHQILGAIAAKEIYEIDDEDILGAIRSHTTARVDMSDLEKIIYVADAIEENRDYPGVYDLREKRFNGLNEITLEVMNQTLIFLIENGYEISTETVDARNYIIERKINGRR